MLSAREEDPVEGKEDTEEDGVVVCDSGVVCDVGAVGELVVIAALLVAISILKPLTGTANMVTEEENTVVVERLNPELMVDNHESVWPAESIDVHWDGKTPTLFGWADSRPNCLVT